MENPDANRLDVTAWLSDLATLINRHGFDGACDMPDYIVAAHLNQCLGTLASTNEARRKHEGDNR